MAKTTWLNVPRGGARAAVRKVDDEMKHQVDDIVERYSAFTLKQIKHRLQLELPDKPRVSISSVAAMLDGQLITLKKLEDAPFERNSPAVKQERRNYATWFTREGVNRNLIYVDECGFNIYTRRTRGRAVCGRRAVR